MTSELSPSGESVIRAEWLEVDLGIMCAGAATTTICPTSTVDDVVHVLADSDSRVAAASPGWSAPSGAHR